MKIAIDISPLSSGHKVRGVGFYVAMIKDNIEKYDDKNEYFFFENEYPGDADVVHYPYFDPFILTLPRKKPKKVVVTVHDLTPIVYKDHFPRGIRGSVNWFIQKMRLKHADVIVTDSNSSKSDVEKYIGIDSFRVKTVYLAADGAFKKLEIGNWKPEIRKKYTLPDNFLLYVGDATWNKNLPALISAVKKTKYKLVIVGKVWESKLNEVSNNPWNKDLKNVLELIESDDQFINLGFVDTSDLVKIYNQANLLVMPSIYEGFGLPVLEAMSCGCPVLATRGGSIPEVGGSAAKYIDGFEEESIADGINNLMTDEKNRNELSKNGLVQANKFTISKMMSELSQIYQKL